MQIFFIDKILTYHTIIKIYIISPEGVKYTAYGKTGVNLSGHNKLYVGVAYNKIQQHPINDQYYMYLVYHLNNNIPQEYMNQYYYNKK